MFQWNFIRTLKKKVLLKMIPKNYHPLILPSMGSDIYII